MVTEMSDEVWVCQSERPWELEMPSMVSEVAKIPAAVSLCVLAIATIFSTPRARWSGVMAAVWSKCRFGIDCLVRVPSPAFGIGTRSGSGC